MFAAYFNDVQLHANCGNIRLEFVQIMIYLLVHVNACQNGVINAHATELVYYTNESFIFVPQKGLSEAFLYRQH